MVEKRTSSSLRVLILTLNLLNTQVGLTAARLLKVVPGYFPGEVDSALRKLERDLATLRETGLDVTTIAGSPPRYRISSASIPADVRLTEQEFRLLSQAAGTWSGISATQGSVVVNKLRAVTEPTAGVGPTNTSFPLEGGAYTPTLHAAIARSQPVSFLYQSKKGLETRDVAPWNLISRGRALYLWGFDLNRWDSRIFRLSRFRSTPELTAEVQTTTRTGIMEPRPFDAGAFLVEPVLAIKQGGAPLTRLKCAELPADLKSDCLPPGWEVLQGTKGDVAGWESTILREADGVVVLEPEFLAHSVRARLESAALWEDSVMPRG